ncbi:MAG: sulfate adenylyltransferase subunit CysN [Algicola sp.]|nr:sulfate adenylyltransferase subunit CysN [Algicola sp.]
MSQAQAIDKSTINNSGAEKRTNNDIDITNYLNDQQSKSLLRLLTCGSVDDGKSTLIGRLLHDSHQLYEDQLETLQEESAKIGTTGDTLDFALLVDGLQAEREQGITIDVAYRYFSTSKRKFIIADTPGHEQYTRNMATGASNCELAIILIDARYGVQVQTKRHSFICDRLGVTQFVIAINKMDLMDYSEQTFEQIKADYLDFSKDLDVQNVSFVPMSALKGENVVEPAQTMPWYKGQPLLSLLEDTELEGVGQQQDVIPEARFPVQYVNRPNLDFRGFSGTLSGSKITVGTAIKVLPSGQQSTIASIVDFQGEHQSAEPGQATTLTLTTEIDISRGDVIVPADSKMSVSNRFTATLVWMSEELLTPGKSYDIKLGNKKTTGSVTSIDHQVNVNTLARSVDDAATSALALNEIGSVQIELTQDAAFDTYRQNRQTGSFIMIDRLSNITVGAGMIEAPINAALNTGSKGADDAGNTSASEFERDLNALVRKHFPHWQALAI